MKALDLTEDQVHLINIEELNRKHGVRGAQGFVIEWNTVMGFDDDGNKLHIDAVIIDTHGNPNELTNNLGWRLTTAVIDTLESKSMGVMMLFGCNVGHLDYKDTNIANAFAKKANGAPVYAADGTVCHAREFGLFGHVSYEARADWRFKEWREIADSGSKRKSGGWIIYQGDTVTATNKSMLMLRSSS